MKKIIRILSHCLTFKMLHPFVLLFAMTLISPATYAGGKETVTYYHHDALGSVVAATNEQGQVIWREEYKPFGSRLVKDTASQNNRVWYTGHVEEQALSLIYMGARWFHSEIGQFLSMDPVGFNEENPQSFNRYAYANQNPYKYVDPDGRQPKIPVDIEFRQGSSPLRQLGSGGGAGGGSTGFRGGAASSGDGGTFDPKIAGRTAGNKAPDFVVSPGGTAFPVPKGATGPTPVVNSGGNQTGAAFTGGSGGANGQVSTMRIMDSTPARGSSPNYPNGYIKYENSASPKPQGVDPYSGKTLPNSKSHFPID